MGVTKHIPRSIKKLEKAVYRIDKQELKEEKEALTVHNYTKTGVHNCPHKDAGTTHAHRARCFKLKHCGYCPVCGNICPWNHGCRDHGIKQSRLLAKCPSNEQKQAYHFDPEDGDSDNDSDTGTDKDEDGKRVSTDTNTGTSTNTNIAVETIEGRTKALYKSRKKP